MSFLEIAVFLIAVFFLYWLLAPLQRKLEHRLHKFFRKKSSSQSDTVIDVTESINKRKK